MNQSFINMAKIVEEKADALARENERREYWRALARESLRMLGFVASIAGFCVALWMVFG